MREKAQKSLDKVADSNLADALAQAAQLASVPQDELEENASSSDSDTDSDSEEEGEASDPSPKEQPEQAEQPKKRKSKLSKSARQAKRKRGADWHTSDTLTKEDKKPQRRGTRGGSRKSKRARITASAAC